MLILPPGHAAQQAQTLRPLAGRERRLILAVGALATALVLVVLVALVAGGRTSAHGCIDVKLAYSTGGAEIYSCGARARATCAGAERRSGLSAVADAAVAAECRKAGVPVG